MRAVTVTIVGLLVTSACVTEDDPPVPDEAPAPEAAALYRPALPANLRVAFVLYDFANTPVDGSPEAVARGTQHLSFNSAVSAILFGSGTSSQTGSLASFFHEVTDGRTTVTGTVFDWTRLARLDHVWRREGNATACQQSPGDPPTVPRALTGTYCNDPVQPLNNTWLIGPMPAGTTTCPPGSSTPTPYTPPETDWCFAPDYVDANLVPTIRAAAASAYGFSSDFTAVTGFREDDFDVVIYASPYGIQGVFMGGKTAFSEARTRTDTMTYAIHETGHVLGLKHAGLASCAVPNDPTTCTRGDQYGDESSMMGLNNDRQFSTYEKVAVRALPLTAMQTVTSSGRVVLPATEIATTQPRLLRIAAAASYPGTSLPAFYYLDTRRAIGFDGNRDWSFNHGVAVRLATDPDRTTFTTPPPSRCGASCGGYNSVRSGLLIDTQPGTATIDDAALLQGASYTDTRTGVTLQVASVDATTTSVDVTFRPQQTRLFFYNPAGGLLRNAWQTPSGVVQPNAQLVASTTWTHVVGAQHGGLLWYNRVNGSGYGAFLDGNDVYHGTGAATLSPGWTHIAQVGRSSYVFYQAGTGRYTTADMAASGALVERASSTGWASDWSLITGTLNGWVVFYRASTGLIVLGRLDATGEITDWRSAQAVRGFTAVASTREGGLVFYSRVTGLAQPAVVDDWGVVTWHDPVSWTAGFDQVVGGGNGALVRYRRTDGAAMAATLDAGYELHDAGAVSGIGAGVLVGSAGGV